MDMKKMMMALMLIVMISGIVFVAQGVMMHSAVDGAEAEFHQLQDDYFSQSKAIRDAAATDSELSETLVTIQQTPSDLLRLKLVGVGKMLTGIFILLFGILIALMTMPIKLGMIIKKHQ